MYCLSLAPMIRVQENINLKDLNSFGIEAKSSCWVAFDDVDLLIDLLKQEPLKSREFRIIGSGTNLLFVSDFPGCLLHPENAGIEVVEESEKDVIVEAGAGLEWDKLVEWAVQNDFYGIENLSLIPGSVGASVVQNIGAYGAELQNYVQQVDVIDLLSGERLFLSREDCKFSYRDSIFKQQDKKSWLVWKVRLVLSKKAEFDLSYGNLKNSVSTLGQATLQSVRRLIISTRQNKLPDPDIIGNAGSFFKNPIVDKAKFDEIRSNFPDLPSYPGILPGSVKIPAAWMIERVGWKGYRSKDAGVYQKQALVLVNHGNASGIEIFNLASQIQESVNSKFGIKLEPEVTIIGSE